ncbi:hypothetical protein TNIN_136671 [Trichonephila inaurata madagascariensis]|uniref:Uncharacterized protein n=1 Tax=Trichonephila inaurata madagascariensis TaxID=2747483 RepID=A0A8X7C1S9_9ARAC|nr:hypothetical protein TNIN_136671 [Trichonephila inaurata madagascariensis]
MSRKYATYYKTRIGITTSGIIHYPIKEHHKEKENLLHRTALGNRKNGMILCVTSLPFVHPPSISGAKKRTDTKPLRNNKKGLPPTSFRRWQKKQIYKDVLRISLR